MADWPKDIPGSRVSGHVSKWGCPVIISASYKTDIPTFYGEWLMNRLDAGYCKVHNPYGGKPFTVSLSMPDVNGFVFWTKNLGSFIQRLASIYDRAFPFVVQYTINNYPRVLEANVVGANIATGHMRTLAQLYGENAAVWRYDTIVFTSETPFDFHVENFKGLAEQLRGTTNEVVISFVQMYRKTRRTSTSRRANSGSLGQSRLQRTSAISQRNSSRLPGRMLCN